MSEDKCINKNCINYQSSAKKTRILRGLRENGKRSYEQRSLCRDGEQAEL